MHEGNNWLYVVTGRLSLLLGNEKYTIGRGEAAAFSPVRHTGSAPSTVQ